MIPIRRKFLLAAMMTTVALAALPGLAEVAHPLPPHGVIGVEEGHLTPDYWIAKLAEPDQVVLDRAALEAQNERLMRLDPSMYDIEALPGTLTRERVTAWIEGLADRPSKLYGVDGGPVPSETLDAIADNRNLPSIAERQAARYGLVVRRADLRTFPTKRRVFRSPGNTDIDRFQESAVFPGTPVVIAHESLDERWWLVVSPRYAAWIEKKFVAEGDADQVFGYHGKAPYRIVTGATVETVFTPEQYALSKLQLDMGVRVPVLSEWEADQPVNGQHPYNAHVIELPVRAEDGRLLFKPALLQQTVDSAGDYLPLTRANVIRQGFKFLGERYGWGHSYNGRDCSGLVSEIYRSMGMQLPRNTSAQSVSPALQTRIFGAADDGESRMAAIGSLDIGDLVFIPGHVMMVIGSIGGEPWVIHDTTGISYATADGSMARVRLNSVAVTPLLPLKLNESEHYVDRMTSIVRIRPIPAKESTPSS